MPLRRLMDLVTELKFSMQNPETQDRVEGQERAYVAWNEVRAFLLMTEEALKAKDVVIEEFQR